MELIKEGCQVKTREIKFVIAVSAEIYRLEVKAGDDIEEEISIQDRVYIWRDKASITRTERTTI